VPNPHLPRYKKVGVKKSTGSTYTPKALSDFIATELLSASSLSGTAIRILDPAVGDGILLESLLERLDENQQKRSFVVAFDTDANAALLAEERLQSLFPAVHFEFHHRSFLEAVGAGTDLFGEGLRQRFDLCIANPPYVRTQILGSEVAQSLAQSYGLRGRIDLYYVFLLAILEMLAPKGLAAVITSNRFMTTRSGQSVRQTLTDHADVRHVWDLGDTKLFGAAVLPAVIVFGPGEATVNLKAGFTSVYESAESGRIVNSVFDALTMDRESFVATTLDGRNFRIQHGWLDDGGTSEGVWRLGSESHDDWVETVRAHTWAEFSRIGKIRVGVKSTADKIFVREDWTDIQTGTPELLRELITKDEKGRFKAREISRRKILYPHVATENGKAAVDLAKFPRTQAYLNAHRVQLESRKYVIAAGRRWYELWVPQDPGAWQATKLVFVDIAERPTFWIDTSGAVVNGECYWVKCDDVMDEPLLWLAAGIANSSFIEEFYDRRFHNKLYSGRRRFMTQYVQQFPLLNPASDVSQEIIDLARSLHAGVAPCVEETEEKIDQLVWKGFGLVKR
jgi:adenine-specific DNA-methyltransferase